jgi:hypothetical protein
VKLVELVLKCAEYGVGPTEGSLGMTTARVAKQLITKYVRS